MAVLWGRFFTTHLEDGLTAFVVRLGDVLKNFEAVLENKIELEQLKPGSRALLKEQVGSRKEVARELKKALSKLVAVQQREASRFFVQSISDSMGEIYAECAAMKGTAIYALSMTFYVTNHYSFTR